MAAQQTLPSATLASVPPFLRSTISIAGQKALGLNAFHAVFAYGEIVDDSTARYTTTVMGTQNEKEICRVVVEDIPTSYTPFADPTVVLLTRCHLVFDQDERPVTLVCLVTDLKEIGSVGDPALKDCYARLPLGIASTTVVGKIEHRLKYKDQKGVVYGARWMMNISSPDGKSTFSVS